MSDVDVTDLSSAAYRQLASFRFQIRRFLQFSEGSAREHGIEPQQHQLMLAIKGLPEGAHPTVTALSERLCLRHHSAVELINRLEERGAVLRRQSEEDRRQVLVELTPRGEELLRKLSVLHWEELKVAGPSLTKALQEIIQQAKPRGRESA